MIEILCPTHKRPQKLYNLIESIKFTAENLDNIWLNIYIDHEDNSYSDFNFINLRVVWGKETILSKMWNRLYKLSTGNILMHCSDDIIFETKGWDTIVENHFKKEPISLLYGRDGHQDENCPTHSFTSRLAADQIGYFVPPYFKADWNDVWLMEVYRRLGKLFYDPEIMTRHLHVNVDLKYNDDTYKLAAKNRQGASQVWEEKKGEINNWVNILKKQI